MSNNQEKDAFLIRILLEASIIFFIFLNTRYVTLAEIAWNWNIDYFTTCWRERGQANASFITSKMNEQWLSLPAVCKYI